MKKSILVAAVALLTISSSFASEKNPKVKDDKKVTEQVGQLLQRPNFEVKQDLTAVVTLMVNKENEVVVLDVDTENEYVSRFIKTRLNYKTLNTKTVGSQFTIPVRIVPEA